MVLARSLAFALLIVTLIWAQTAPSFDVAAIKPADPANSRFGMGFSANGRTLTVDGFNLAQMIREAYGIFPDLLSISPSLTNSGWINSEKFDINAKSEGTTALSREQSNQLFRQLLAERFGVKIHHEMKEITVYSLVQGKTGSKMKPGSGSSFLSAPRPGQLVSTNASMGSLARGLSGRLGRPVQDDTGLHGGFDFSLSWTPESADSASDTSGPSIFTALQEQLGLRLETKKVAMDAIVVDAASKPTSN